MAPLDIILLNAPPMLYAALIVVAMLFIFNITLLIRSYKKAAPDSVIIRTGIGGAKVFVGGAVIFPIIHQYHIVNIAARQFILDTDTTLKGGETKKLSFSFTMQVERTPTTVLKVVQFAGVDRMEKDEEILNLFKPRFQQTIQIVASQFTLEELKQKQHEIIDQVCNLIGTDLNGFRLEEVNIIQ
jgi:flotillin